VDASGTGKLGGMKWGSYAAIGDSFTEGLDDPDPSGEGYRGWADLVAAQLAAGYRQAVAGRPAAEERRDFKYANLAVRGRLFNAIVDEQVAPVLRMRPDLISFAGGGNDVLRRGFEPSAMLARFSEVIRVLRASDADVLLFKFADVTRRLPGGRVILPRVERLNRAVDDVAEKYGATVVDLWSDTEFDHSLMWSVDRLHLSGIGHRRVAAHVLTALGVAPDPEWFAVPPPIPRPSWAAARGADLRWAGQHLAPWVKRRLTGRSSGDLITAKRPALAPLPSPATEDI
jgi:lysophospholipase L1-like esterase